MEISYKKDGINNYMIIRNQKDVENDYKLQMLINNKIEGILSINIKKINNENQFYYDITSKNSMRSLFVKNKVGAKDIEQFINSMAIVAKSMKEYLLDINNIVFDMDIIYWDSKKKVYNFCYYPFTEQGMKEGLNGLFLELLELLNHNDREAVVIGYGLQQKIISENFTITELKEYVAENIKMPGNNINKYSYEKAKKSNYYNEKQNDDLEDLDNIIEEDADEYFDSTDFENDNINKRFSNKNEKERKQKEKRANKKKEKEKNRKKNKEIKENIKDSAKNKNGKTNTKSKKWWQFWKRSKPKKREELLENNFIKLEETDGFDDIEKFVASEMPVKERDSIDEEATVLLTSNVHSTGILLRSTDIENPVTIIPNGFPCIIGKSGKSSDYKLEEQFISRVHARIYEEMDGYYIEDLNSSNGTFVNGEKLKPHTQVMFQLGDIIMLADMEFVVE